MIDRPNQIIPNVKTSAQNIYTINTVSIPYLPTPSARGGYDTGSIFKRSLTGLNSELFLRLD